MHKLLNRLINLFEPVTAELDAGERVVQIANARGAARYFLISHLLERSKVSPLLVICENSMQAERACAHAISAYRMITGKVEKDEQFLVFPDSEPKSVFDSTPRDSEIEAMRRGALDSLLWKRAGAVFAPVQAVFRRLPNPDALRFDRLTLSVGKKGGAVSSMQVAELSELLTDYGYSRESLVFEPGSYSVRGGLVDVYPAGAQAPVRLDFFGASLEEISLFNPETQRSFEKISEVTILPVKPSISGGKKAAEKVEARLDEYIKEYGSKLPGSTASLAEIVREDIGRIKDSLDFQRSELYSSIYSDSFSVIDYLPEGAAVFLHDEGLLKTEVLSFEKFWRSRFEEWRGGALTIADFGDYYTIPKLSVLYPIIEEPAFQNRNLRALASSTFDVLYAGFQAVDLNLSTPSSSKFRLGTLVPTLKDMRMAAGEVWIASQFAERLRERIAEEGAVCGALEKAIIPGGFSFPGAGHLITDAEILGEIEETVVRKSRKFEKTGVKSLHEIKIGDFVVHVDYGIGRFVALKDQEVGGVKRSYVEIEYDGKDKLYVPVDQLGRLRRYRYDGSPPNLDKLGRKNWTKNRAKIRRDSIRLALQLYRLYRERSKIKGVSHGEQDGWMDEFSSSFPYELTPDQAEAWESVRKDMEASRPMDRLICGDVGFGKTEVAMRAAFLACENEKQVMVLCPTTILADQHFHTFRRRFAAFPFRVEMLSRFLSDKEQEEIVERFNRGKVDVIVGTHRLLSKDITPPKLGLLIIDEEQRFGVKQKEKFKLRFPGVDSLMLTATPIPRTMHMAMSGMMDLSIIETPPVDRKPVRTYVGEYSESLLRDAIMREMGRGGQVYFLHNRIADIDRFKEEIETIVPEAKITVAHGKMKEEALEEIMNAFSMGAFHVLLATTIIENGLDIPNVNTLIVERAEMLGLAQMHQLRGRVGRSRVQAYAYFFHHPERSLTADAQGRLQAIYNYAYFGAGYEIAQSDLRLRGAGNIFGSEQSGMAAAVGYDYFFELLETSFDAVKAEIEARGGEDGFDEKDLLAALEREEAGCFVDIPVPAFIPPAYVEDSVVRLDVLRRIARLELAEIDDFRAEIVDRFGEPPLEVENLLRVIGIKTRCEAAGISAVEYRRATDSFRFKFRTARPAWTNKVTLLDGRAAPAGNDALDLKMKLDENAAENLQTFSARLHGLIE